MLKKTINFVKEAKVELKKVNWPTKKQVKNYTLVVIGLSLTIAVFLGGVDHIFSYLLKKILIK